MIATGMPRAWAIATWLFCNAINGRLCNFPRSRTYHQCQEGRHDNCDCTRWLAKLSLGILVTRTAITNYCGQLIAETLSKRRRCLEENIVASDNSIDHFSLQRSANLALASSRTLSFMFLVPEGLLAEYSSQCEFNVHGLLRQPPSSHID